MFKVKVMDLNISVSKTWLLQILKEKKKIVDSEKLNNQFANFQKVYYLDSRLYLDQI